MGETEQNAGATNSPAAKQATAKQLIAIVFILALATNMFLLPIFLIRATGRDAYIAIAVGCGFDLVSLVIALAAMRLSKNADFFELLGTVFGKVGARITAGVIGLFLFFKLNIAVTETLGFYADNVFADFDIAIMIIVLLIFLTAVGAHTLRALCRLNELLVPIIIVCVAMLAAIVIMTGFDLSNILPAMTAPRDFLSSSARHAAWLGDFTPLVLFIGRTEMKKHTGAIAATSGVVGAATAVFFAIVMCAAFGNVPLLVDSSTNLSSILQFYIGNVYGRIDLFSSILWSISAFIETALFFYATCRCVSFAIGKNAHLLTSLGVCVVLYFTQVFAMTDPTIFTIAVTSIAASVATPIFTLAIPLVALVCAAICRRRAGKITETAQENSGESNVDKA